MKNIITIAGICIAALSTPALAENNYYNIGATVHSYEDYSITSLTGRLGTEFAKNVGAEVEGGFGLTTADVFGVDVKIKSNLGAYLVARAPINENLNLLGRAGYHIFWAEAEYMGFTETADDGDTSFGFGAEYKYTSDAGIRFDYTRLIDNETNNFAVTYLKNF